jgi:hypothetical protein
MATMIEARDAPDHPDRMMPLVGERSTLAS